MRGRFAVVVVWALAASAFLFLAWRGWRESSAPPRRPDVVLVVIDTLRADRLSCYGYPRATSPFIDSLARRGALFEDVTCQFSWTRPSMVSLLEGRYLTAYRDALEPSVPTLAEVFHGAGYRTVGLVANGLLSPTAGFARGFDHYDSHNSSEATQVYSDFLRDLGELSADLWGPLDAALAVDAEGRRPPLFLYLHVMDVHDPYDPYPEFDASLPVAQTAPVAPEGWQAATFGAKHADAKDVDVELAELRDERGRYDQGIRHTDAELERVFARLGELGVLEHTVIALAADHGEGLWEHVAPNSDAELAQFAPKEFFYQRHGASQFQEVLATPLIVLGPGVPSGRRVAEPVENVDLFPTLMELCDLAPPAGLHGRSLLARLELSRASEAHRDFVFSYGVHGNSVREIATGLKLIVPRGRALVVGQEFQLFDLRADPDERNDLAHARPADVKRLMGAFRAWEKRYPTSANLGEATRQRLKAEQGDLLKGLGYTALDVGDDE
ncbi:MAG: sulfatase [Planctomycetes bacterium]|nr:sulfatase [Planctomycetota bacterium]